MAESRRTRKRIDSLKIDKEAIAERIKDFYDKDHQDRKWEIDARLQRYAKYRMWTEGKDWPWDNACFSLDSELLTANGWKFVAEMQAGDLVYTRATNGCAEYRPVAYTVCTMSQEAIAFKGKSIDLLVTPNHRMLIEDWSGKTRLVPAAEFVGLQNKAWAIPLTSEWRGENPEKINGLPAREYLRLLGWYVAEGSKNNGGTLAITQSRTANPEKCAIIERDLENAGVTWNYNRNDFYLHSSTVPAPVLQELRSLGLCNEKILPDYVMDLASPLLAELLDAMVLGDGSVKLNGHTSYSTTSKVLADQVQIIAQKIGKRATITVHKKDGGVIDGRKINGNLPLFVVNINAKKTVQVRKLNVQSIKLAGPMAFACVNVPPYNTLYVRRNGIATWCGNTDAAIPDMMTASMRLQDTLHNAVMSARPPIRPKAMRPTDKEKEEKIAHLIDFQFFEEQQGEVIVGQLADDFVNEGFFTAYTPWIEEHRRTKEIKLYDAPPEDALPADYFASLLRGFFPKGEITPSEDGWDFKIKDGEKRAKASFFTKDDQVEMELEREVEVFNGPRCIRKDLQDILHPARCENLQIQSPSNPTGASHVIMRDYPSVDELKRLHKSGYYDLLSGEDAKKLGLLVMDTSNQEREEQKDVFQGHTSSRNDLTKGAESHKPLTRLMCFDTFDIDGDGLDEDVVFWMLLEDKIILKAVYLSQVFPSSPPRRPFAEAGLFPVPGRRYAIGLLEMMEGLHDLMKQFFDQGGDAGTLANAPFGFYRASSNVRPEVISMSPGEMYPLSNPKDDVHFPTLGNQNQAFMFNMVTMITQIEERLTNIGDLQLGRVPQGKASALRTVSGMQTVLSQGDARPERVLRRFFIGLAQIFENFHALNEIKLTPKKRFMLSGPIDPRVDPYGMVESAQEIRGKFRFTFSANVLNTSKEALQMALQDLMATYISPLAIQLGITKPDGAYRLLRDFGLSKGQDPDKYISPPTPGAMDPPITAEEAILQVMDGFLPKGTPMEGTAEHFEKLQTFMQSDEFGYIQPERVPIFRAYMEQVAQIMAQEQSQAILMKAAAQFGGQPGQPGPMPGPQQGGGQAMPMLQNNELADETLPGAGGGANPGVPQ